MHNGPLDQLRGYGVLDTPNEPEFDALVRRAAEITGTPMALISLIDEHRQWFKARIGIEVRETPLAISFCTHAVRGTGVFTVADATVDERFARNPLVTGDPHVRFYAGAPLATADGTRIGTICVLDDKPHVPFTAEQEGELTRLADQVIATLDARRRRGASPALAPVR